MNLFKNMIISSVLLALFAILIPPTAHDNDIFNDIIKVKNKELLGSNKEINIYRARKDNKPVAVIINSVAPDGYSGNIELLVAINFSGTLEGVRVVQHKETPGLGDAIEENRSDWITRFKGKSLANPDKRGWAVKRDGGEFDQFTGATITPRAIVKAVYNTLRYYKKHRDTLYE